MDNTATGSKPNDGENNPSGKPVSTPTKSDTPPKEKGETAKSNTNEWREWGKFVVEVFTLLAVAYYASVAHRQLTEMHNATIEATHGAIAAKKAADVASNSLTNSQMAFEVDQRPYMVAESPLFVGNGVSPDKPIEANVTFRNIGRTPARKYIVEVALRRLEGEKGDNGRKKLMRFLASSFGALESNQAKGRKEIEQYRLEQDIAPNGTIFSTNPSDAQSSTIVSAQEVSKIETGEIALFYIGVVSYSDAFQNTYQTEFCYIYFGTDPKTWHICDSHNTIK